MSWETEIYLKDNSDSLIMLGTRQKQTLLSKKTIPLDQERSLREAITMGNTRMFEDVVAELMMTQIAQAKFNGWSAAPGGYFMRHHGFLVSGPMFAPNGVRSDITLTVRTVNSICN